MQSSLVNRTQNLPPRSSSSWTSKQRRSYQRLLSGLKHHQARGHQVRILTLTSVPGTSWRQLNSRFQALRKRIERKYAKMDYWKLRTYEGQGAGVLHVLYIGAWIPQAWLSRVWDELTGAPIVYIQQLKKRYGSRRIARYMISHYMAHHEVSRQSWSWGWLFRGFVGYWHRIVRASPCFGDAIIAWTRIVSKENPKKWAQIHLGEYYIKTRLKKRVGSLSDVIII